MDNQPPARLACDHDAPAAPGRVCEHLVGQPDGDYWRRFTGTDRRFDLVCYECSRDAERMASSLREVCDACFRRVDDDGYWSGIVGRPEVRERTSGLRFRHEHAALSGLPADEVLDVQPIEALARPVWIAVTAGGAVVRIDAAAGSATVLADVSVSKLDLAQPVTLRVAPDGRFAAIANTRGQHGAVVDLTTGSTTMELARGTYCMEHSNFPLAFCSVDGQTRLVHGIDWNRLDVSDPATGQLLSERSPTMYRKGEARPPHYLDYFHCGLLVSPNGEWIADNGWVWHPIGVVSTWGLRRWLTENVWESEDGPSKRYLGHRDYFWDGPICWVDADTLAIWGYGNDDEWLIPAVRLFDVRTGEELRWFAGPVGSLVFDRYLFSIDAEQGRSVWDVATGERLLRAGAFAPRSYHRGAGCFLTLEPGGTCRITRLVGGDRP